jgi:hypothetical protein
MVYDNPKTVVDAILSGKDRQFNRRFLEAVKEFPTPLPMAPKYPLQIKLKSVQTRMVFGGVSRNQPPHRQ